MCDDKPYRVWWLDEKAEEHSEVVKGWIPAQHRAIDVLMEDGVVALITRDGDSSPLPKH